MERRAFFLTLFLFLVGCASINPYDVPEGDGAYLKNRKEMRGKSTLLYYFSSVETVDGKRKRLSSFMRGTDEIFKIPSGEVYLGLEIRYGYKEGIGSFGEALSTAFTYLYSSESRAKVDAARAEVDLYAENIKIDAIEGQTYQINCDIKDGKALIWIEDDTGMRVSEVVRGFSIFWGERDWLRQNVPDPSY